MKALLCESVHPEAIRILKDQGFEVETRAGALDTDDLIAALDGVSVLGIRSATQVTRRVLDAAPELQAIGAFCIGTNQIDLDAASARGIAVFNAPYSNTRSVVELAISEIIALARHLTDHSAALHAGSWNKTAKGSHEVRGRTLGIVGYGSIGTQLSVVAESLGMQVYFYDLVDRPAMGNAVRCDSLEELLDRSETVTLHIDGRAANKALFGAREFARMRPRSLFLNLSRGHIVDVDALVDALRSGQLAGAALDVYPSEPQTNADPFSSPLQGLPNVILTPHIGGSTEEAQSDIGRFVATKLGEYTARGATTLSVNLPQVAVAAHDGFRIGHLHTNVPGVLAKVNTLLAGCGANITAQTLATAGQLGYAVLDLDRDPGAELLTALRALPETVRIELR